MKNAAIIGCGNISGFLDSPTDTQISTHAHAYREHASTQLIAVCDPDVSKREAFITRWGKGIRGYDSVNELLAHEKIDIISICSPTAFHAQGLKEALQDKTISSVLCEKPFVQTQEELSEIIPLLKKSNKKVLINFIRRYDPSIQSLKQRLDSKELGELLHFHANFTKGLYHNGSHMLELIEYLCGKIRSIRANKILSKEEDLYGNFYLETTWGHGSIQNENGENYALFELELVLTQARIKIKESGHCIEIETVQSSKRYPGYFALEYAQTLEDTMQKNLYHALCALMQEEETNVILQDHLQLSQKLLDIKANLYTKHFLEFT